MTMLLTRSSSNLLQGSLRVNVGRSVLHNHVERRLWTLRPSSSAKATSAKWTSVPFTPQATSFYQKASCYMGMLLALGVATVVVHDLQERTVVRTLLDAAGRKGALMGGDIIQTGTPILEPTTGILFPMVCNGFDFCGCGVRIKWGLIKVYAVGTYMDRIALSAVQKSRNPATLQEALLNPDYPRTIRIVMARDLSVKKFTSAIVEALEPRMNGQDLEKLEEFQKLMPPVDLIKGSEMLMTIRGDSLLFKNATGGIGEVRSRVFTTAMCDVYYGKDAVSQSHKSNVMEGVFKRL